MVGSVFADWADYDYVWFEGWNKRQVLRVDQTTGAGANYELKINVTWTEDYRSDFKDLRITYLNGTDLTWWIEQLVSDSFCALWLKVPVDLDAESFDCFWWSQNPIADIYYNSSATDVFKRVISSGVILALPIDEGEGTTLEDYSGNGYDGTFEGAGQSWVAGKHISAVSFNGNGLVNTGVNVIGANQSFSVFAWALWADDTYYKGIVSEDFNGARDWHLTTQNRATIQTRVYDGAGASKTDTAALDSCLENVWNHVGLVYDQTVQLYPVTNGVIDAGVASVGLKDNGTPLRIGYMFDNTYRFIGLITEVFVFNYALAQAEIDDLYSYYPQCSSANLGSLFLRTFVSGGVSYGFIVMEDTSNMDYIYLVGLLGVIGVSLVLFKLKLGVVGLVWGIFGIAIAASLVGNQAVPFYPYLTLGVAVVGTLLVMYSGYEMRGA